jgi:zinc/manganese transport system substrate-binding protein
MPAARARRTVATLAAAALLTASLSGCGEGIARGSGPPQVVAAESMWGSIAQQLAGSGGHTASVIANPALDPHSYEPTAADARALATAQLVIVNGLGYDPWARHLLAANPQSGRIVLDVGTLLHVADGGNPHRWYDPADVDAVAHAITTDLTALDPARRAFYAQRLGHFEHVALAPYHRLIAAVRRRYAAQPVGASESIFALLAPVLGLHLLTPPSFMKAVSEGAELSARDTATARAQITARQIRVWVFNAQNATPEIGRLNALAHANGIPVTAITETPTPAGTSFEAWQVGQLQRLAAALHEATGR